MRALLLLLPPQHLPSFHSLLHTHTVSLLCSHALLSFVFCFSSTTQQTACLWGYHYPLCTLLRIQLCHLCAPSDVSEMRLGTGVCSSVRLFGPCLRCGSVRFTLERARTAPHCSIAPPSHLNPTRTQTSDSDNICQRREVGLLEANRITLSQRRSDKYVYIHTQARTQPYRREGHWISRSRRPRISSMSATVRMPEPRSRRRISPPSPSPSPRGALPPQSTCSVARATLRAFVDPRIDALRSVMPHARATRCTTGGTWRPKPVAVDVIVSTRSVVVDDSSSFPLQIAPPSTHPVAVA